MWSVCRRRRLDSHDPTRRQTTLQRVVAHRVADLGGQHHLIATTGKRPAEELLGHPEVVDVGGVEERNPGRQRLIDHLPTRRLVGVAPPTEHHRAEPENADVDATGTELPILHRQARPAWRWNTKLSQ